MKRRPPARSKAKAKAKAQAAISTPLPVGDVFDLYSAALSRVIWVGERDEAGDVRKHNRKEAEARADEALRVYAKRSQQLSPLLWFREPDALLAWREDCIKDPIAVIAQAASSQKASAAELVRRIVNESTMPVFYDEAVDRQLTAGDTCGKVSAERLNFLAFRFLQEAVPESCDWELVQRNFMAHKDSAIKELFTVTEDAHVYTAATKRGRLDQRLFKLLTARGHFYKLPDFELPSLSDEQRRVFSAVLHHIRSFGWAVLDGVGGAGKTHLLQLLLTALDSTVVQGIGDGPDCPNCGQQRMARCCRACGHMRELEGPRHLRVAFLGPTNRAVAVLVDGMQQSSVELTFGTVHALSRKRDLLVQDLVVIDESSMLGAEHGDLLVRCAPFKDAAWLLVGDRLQLPPVGRGELFRPLVQRSALPALETNRRARSEVLRKLIADIRAGLATAAIAYEMDGTCDLMSVIEQERCDLVLCVRNEERVLFNCHMIQKSPCSRHVGLADDYRNLSRTWTSAQSAPRAFVPFVGLPVRLQTNEHKPAACRGSLGVIQAVAQRDRGWELRVEFGKHSIDVAATHFGLPDLMRPAYAVTLHDAQGSQRAKIGIVLPPSAQCPLLTLETLYTAASRAQDQLVFFAPRAPMSDMLGSFSKPAPLRLTPFAVLLRTK